ncbi:MAG: DUF169 domain-containing protein [Desulfobacterales bacterium]|jgi:uncharacterized protein (DUF169 family)
MNIGKLELFLKTLGLFEAPMGLFYTDTEPAEGFSPPPGELPTRDREKENQIDWQQVFSSFSCFLQKTWLARKKHTAAYISAERFGCPGAAFWLGFLKPQTETIIHYVSSGIPDRLPGEHYCESPDELRRIFAEIDPRPAPAKYCVIKPLDLFTTGEVPEVVAFFARPESMAGLHQLAAFVTNDPEVVASPWSAACGGLGAWPLKFISEGKIRAVIGGWDPSARKFYKADELSFAMPLSLFQAMLDRFEDSFLMTETWQTVKKKIERSKKAWGEDA